VWVGLTTAAAVAIYGVLMLPLALEPPLGQYLRGAVSRLRSWLPGRPVQLPGTPR
jgi:hypothetical protein